MDRAAATLSQAEDSTAKMKNLPFRGSGPNQCRIARD
jgi:hypothetical protein